MSDLSAVALAEAEVTPGTLGELPPATPHVAVGRALGATRRLMRPTDLVNQFTYPGAGDWGARRACLVLWRFALRCL